MIDHLSILVPKDKFKEVVDFYLAALAPVGYIKAMEFAGVVGLGETPTTPDFWVGAGDETAAGGGHFAIAAKGHKAVNEFYDAAIKAGGKDNGKPGLRPQYHPSYYAAFVIDPVENRVEVVCHKPDNAAAGQA